jgi:endonuclease-3 related protein
MDISTGKLARILDRLEKLYGEVSPPWPSDPYEMILWTNCGYPASDAKCDRGFTVLKKEIGLRPEQILKASKAKLARVLRDSTMIPQLGTERLKEIARMVQEDYDGDLRTAIRGSLPVARRILKKFPVIGDPCADKILLFAKIAPLPAVPSNCLEVPLRMGFGEEDKNYAKSYRSIQQALAAELPETFAARQRAYLLLKHHAKEICKRSKPLCDRCPVTQDCSYFLRLKAGAALAPVPVRNEKGKNEKI